MQCAVHFAQFVLEERPLQAQKAEHVGERQTEAA
jgi:hypothetical protein